MCFHRREQIPSLQIQMDHQSDYDWKVQQGGDDHKFQKQNFLPKRILQFVFSVSVLSFLLWYSFGCSILPHDESLNAFFSTFLFSIFSHTLERKYMFLLCNAILAFLVKTSLSISADTDESLSETNAIPVSVEAPSSLMAEEQETDNNKEQVPEDDDDEEQDDGENIEASPTAKEDDEKVGTTGEVMGGTQEDDDEGDDDTRVAAENEELSNADELNRKFEEFIRKMKEEIRIEAQRQLIAAV